MLSHKYCRKYGDADRKSNRRVSKEVLDRRRTATLINISGDCTAAEFAAALQNTKPCKALKPYSINAELGTWLPLFLLVLPHYTQSLGKSSCICDSKALKTQRGIKELLSDLFALRSL